MSYFIFGVIIILLINFLSLNLCLICYENDENTGEIIEVNNENFFVCRFFPDSLSIKSTMGPFQKVDGMLRDDMDIEKYKKLLDKNQMYYKILSLCLIEKYDLAGMYKDAHPRSRPSRKFKVEYHFVYMIGMKALIFVLGFVAINGQFQGGFQGQQQQMAPVPPFLYGASQQTINSFMQLTREFNGLVEADIDQRMNRWVAQQSPDIRSKYTLMRAEELQRKKWREAEQAEMVSHLSPEAQAAERRFTAIEHDPRLTPQQKYQQTMQLKNTLPKQVVNEIDQMFQNQMRQHQQGWQDYHKQQMAKLSPAARMADARLSAIDQDQNLQPQQKMQQIQAILRSLPKNVQDELQQAMRG